jgi:hypothetical protein
MEPIPRHAWVSHPNYPAQVLLLGSHENFRRISRHLVERAAAADDLPYVGALYRRWIAAMRSHEHYEEAKLYPFLARRFGLSFAVAEAGHHELHERDRAVRWSLVGVENDASTSTLKDALEAHDETLVSHLEHEENLVIPALLQLQPKEFRATFG